MKPFRIECGLSRPSAPDAIVMDVQGDAKNVNLRIDYITRGMLGNVPDLLIDLLEVAAYVYCVDPPNRSRGYHESLSRRFIAPALAHRTAG